MPTSLFSEMDRGTTTGSLEEQRALQLAFELSMLGLEGTPGNTGSTGEDTLATPASVFEEARSKKSQNMTECVPVPSSEHVAEIVGRQGRKKSTLIHFSHPCPDSFDNYRVCLFLFFFFSFFLNGRDS